MSQPLHPMDKWPPDTIGEWRTDDSVDVLLRYADGTTATGCRSGWVGWMRLDSDGVPQPCEDDETQPVGWSEAP